MCGVEGGEAADSLLPAAGATPLARATHPPHGHFPRGASNGGDRVGPFPRMQPPTQSTQEAESPTADFTMGHYSSGGAVAAPALRLTCGGIRRVRDGPCAVAPGRPERSLSNILTR